MYANKQRSAKDSGRGRRDRHRVCWLHGDPDHLSFACPDRSDLDNDDAKGGCGRSASCRPRWNSNPRKEKQSNKSTSVKDADSSAGGKGRDNKEASCSQANPAVVLLDSGCSHHLMGTKDAFVDLEPSGDVIHVRGFNGALQDLKENSVRLQEDGDEMLRISAAGNVLGRAAYTGRVLYTDLCPCSAKSTSPTMEVVALQAIVSATKSTPDRLHARLAQVAMDTIWSSAKHEVATGLDLKSTSGADSPCISCVGGKLVRHTFPDQGSNTDGVQADVHIDLCGPFRVAAKDSSLYFLMLKDRKTRYVWVRPVFKKSDALQEFVQWLAVAERQTKKSVLRLRSDRGGEFLGKKFTAFVDGKEIVHDLTCPYTPQQNDMAEREIRTMVESVQSMLLHMGVQHHCVSEESKGWELLDITDNREVTTSDVVFYENMLLEVWKSEHGLASRRMPTTPPTDTSRATLPLLAEVGDLTKEDAVVRPPSPSPAPPTPPLVADLRGLTTTSASGDEGRSGASPVAPANSITSGQRDAVKFGVGAKLTPTGEQQTKEVQPTLVKPTGEAGDDGGDSEELTDSDVVEVQLGPRLTGRLWRPPDFYVPAAFTTVYNEVDDDLLYDDGKEDEELSELDPDMHADPEHCWDISTMTVKEVLASWKGKVVKTAMEEEIRSLISMGTWELVERPPGINIMKNRWVLTTKYRIDDTVKHEKARLVVKGFIQVYGAGYDKTYTSVSSFVTLKIFLSIVAVLNLNLMQLDMKNAFLQSKLNQVLYMYQPDHFNDGTSRVCKLLKSLYGLNQSPLLWYRALDVDWRKSQVDEASYFKVGADGVACWVLVYVDDLLAASSNTVMPKKLKELLPARKLWLHQQCYTDKLRRRFINEEKIGRTPKMPVSVAAYAELTFDDEEEKERQEEEYRQKFGSLQFVSEYVATTEAGKEGRRLCFLLAEFWQLDAGTPTVLGVDNKSAITVPEGMGLTGNLKHMERRQA
ncbi:unnamed protein product [Closterium sp. NIES-53]